MHRRDFIASSLGGLMGAAFDPQLGVPHPDSLQSKSRVVRHPPGGYAIYAVPHSHQALEWFWTFDQQKALSIKIFRDALEMLKRDPRYAFTQDYKILLKAFWEALSDSDKDFLRQMVEQGRFEVATGMYGQPDMQAPDFESLTRQFLFGKPWEQKVLQAKILTSWNIDTYGQPPQMPQLFRKAGIPYFVFMRDVLPSLQNSVKSPFYWRSPSGHKVLAYWLSSSYAVNTEDPAQPVHSGPPLRVLVDHNVEGNDKIMMPWGRDFYDPNQTSHQIELLIRKAAEELKIPVKSVAVTTPSHYFQDIEKSGVPLPTYTYDFNPPLLMEDLRGQYAERPAEKLAEREADDMLESSEKFSSIAEFYGQPYPAEKLWAAWEKVMFNQEHDQVPGSHTDEVDKDTMSRYHGALEAGRVTLNEALYNLSREVDTSRYGDFPFLVFNALSYPRTEVVHYEPAVSLYKDTSGSETTNFRILDDMGNVQPFWLVARSHYSRFLSMAVVEFMTTVPALGYRLYRIEKMEGEAQPQRWHPANEEISNRFFTLHLNRTTGSISSLVDRRSGKELLNTMHYGGNEVVLKEEKNPELEGPIHFTGDEIRTRGIQPDCTEQVDQPFGSRLRIRRPFLGGVVTQEIALYNELPRIDFKVRLSGFPGHDGMLMVVFPLRGGAAMESYYEINNAVIERPNGIYGGQTWAGLQDSSGGVAILNQGTSGYQIENGNISLILLRSVTHYQFYYSPKASEAGSHEFNYSLCSYQGDWSDSVVTEQAHSFNSPLRVMTTGTHPGSLPVKQDFLSVESGHFEVTALKKAEQGDDLVLRGYETAGKKETVRLRIGLPVLEAHLADLLERGGEELPVQQNRIEFECRPFEFITMRLRVEHDEVSSPAAIAARTNS